MAVTGEAEPNLRLSAPPAPPPLPILARKPDEAGTCPWPRRLSQAGSDGAGGQARPSPLRLQSQLGPGHDPSRPRVPRRRRRRRRRCPANRCQLAASGRGRGRRPSPALYRLRSPAAAGSRPRPAAAAVARASWRPLAAAAAATAAEAASSWRSKLRARFR